MAVVENHDESLSLYAVAGNASGAQHATAFPGNYFDIFLLPRMKIFFVWRARIS
jgi:hypothetical protein